MLIFCVIKSNYVFLTNYYYFKYELKKEEDMPCGVVIISDFMTS